MTKTHGVSLELQKLRQQIGGLKSSHTRLIRDYTKLEEQYRDLETNYHAVCAHKVTLALERKKKISTPL